MEFCTEGRGWKGTYLVLAVCMATHPPLSPNCGATAAPLCPATGKLQEDKQEKGGELSSLSPEEEGKSEAPREVARG
jgi:hypothetical protein